ncbi:hypothetical protein [Mycoplasma sp. VS31B]
MKYKYPENFVYGLWTLWNIDDNPEDSDNFELYGEYKTIRQLEEAMSKYIVDYLFNFPDNLRIKENTLQLDTDCLNFRDFTYEDIKNQFSIQKIYILENGEKKTQYELELEQDKEAHPEQWENEND